MNRWVTLLGRFAAIVGAAAGLSIALTFGVSAYRLHVQNAQLRGAMETPFDIKGFTLSPYLQAIPGQPRVSHGETRGTLVLLVDDYCESCAVAATGSWQAVIGSLLNTHIGLTLVTAGSPEALEPLAKHASVVGIPYAAQRITDVGRFMLYTGIRRVPTLLVLNRDGEPQLIASGPLDEAGITQVQTLLMGRSGRPYAVLQPGVNTRSLIPAHAFLPDERCVVYAPSTLYLQDRGREGWELASSDTALQLLDNKVDAEAALVVARRHLSKCEIESQGQAVLTYWKPDPRVVEAPQPSPVEECLPFDGHALRVASGEGDEGGAKRWTLHQGRRNLAVFETEVAAYRALIVASQYSSHCFIGRDNTRPNRDAYIVEFWK